MNPKRKFTIEEANASDGITEGRSKESVVDLADPAAPRLVLSRDESSREAPTVLSAGRAYWERSRLIYTVDLGTSPQAPSVWSCPDEFDWFQPMAAAGSTLFGAGAERGGTRGGVFVLELDEPGGGYGEGGRRHRRASFRLSHCRLVLTTSSCATVFSLCSATRLGWFTT